MGYASRSVKARGARFEALSCQTTHDDIATAKTSNATVSTAAVEGDRRTGRAPAVLLLMHVA
ncbi:hypothetical protein GCM10027586_21210 [Kineococcus gypseus]